jgi:hypothetical protein
MKTNERELIHYVLACLVLCGYLYFKISFYLCRLGTKLYIRDDVGFVKVQWILCESIVTKQVSNKN